MNTYTYWTVGYVPFQDTSWRHIRIEVLGEGPFAENEYSLKYRGDTEAFEDFVDFSLCSDIGPLSLEEILEEAYQRGIELEIFDANVHV